MFLYGGTAGQRRLFHLSTLFWDLPSPDQVGFQGRGLLWEGSGPIPALISGFQPPPPFLCFEAVARVTVARVLGRDVYSELSLTAAALQVTRKGISSTSSCRSQDPVKHHRADVLNLLLSPAY